MFQTEHVGRMARIILDRPKARNAIPLAGWVDLSNQIEAVARSSAELLVISGAGGAFCAGADLGDFARLNQDPAARTEFRQQMRAALDRIRNLEIPVIAWIEGPCYGAGVALAMACDLRVAGPSASFAITPAKIGISYPQADVHRLVELVGPGQSARLLFSALSIDSAEAHRIGLTDLIADEIRPLAEAILANEHESLRVLKRSIGLAAKGRRHDDLLDQHFDDLIAGEALARRLEAMRRK